MWHFTNYFLPIQFNYSTIPEMYIYQLEATKVIAGTTNVHY